MGSNNQEASGCLPMLSAMTGPGPGPGPGAAPEAGGSSVEVELSPFLLNTYIQERSSQTYPLDWDSIRVKCPCCCQPMKLRVDWRHDGVEVALIPVESNKQISSSSSSIASLNAIQSIALPVPNSVRETHPRPHPHQQENHRASNSGLNEGRSSESFDSSSSEVINNSLYQLASSCLGKMTSPLGASGLHPKLDRKSADNQMAMIGVSPLSSLSGKHHHHHHHQQQSQSKRESRSSHSHSRESHSVPIYNPIQRMGQPYQYRCQVQGCELYFINSQQLELHYKEHKGEKIQKCDWYQCNRLFSSKEKLRNHIRCRHTGERPYKCDDCGKAFTSPKHLKDHRVLHTGERPFECEWDGCGLKFRRRHHLVAHKRVHTKERPYPCEFPGCEMKFTKSHHVKRHFETHFKKQSLTGPLASGSRLDNNGLLLL